LSLRIHYASLHICRFLCEVACLSVKWTVCTHSKHVIMCTRTVLSRTWLKVQEALKVKFRQTVEQDHRRIQREVIQHNFLHPCVHLHRYLHRCVQSMNFSDHSRSALFFFTVSHLPLGLSTSLSQDTMFFFLHILYRTRVCMLYSALEFVYSLGHLSLSIIQHLSLYFFYITLELVYTSQLSLWIISHLSLYMILHWTLHVLSHLIMYIIAHWSLYLL